MDVTLAHNASQYYQPSTLELWGQILPGVQHLVEITDVWLETGILLSGSFVIVSVLPTDLLLL